jgi:hypothetical protein
LILKGQASEQVSADEVDTGIGPVLTLDDLRVRWTFMGLDACFLELRDDEEPIKGEA